MAHCFSAESFLCCLNSHSLKREKYARSKVPPKLFCEVSSLLCLVVFGGKYKVLKWELYVLKC
jgi:hypothetical protein